MKITLSVDGDLVKRARKIAAERDNTLTGMIREYLQQVVAEDALSARRRRDLEILRQSFKRLQFKIGKRTWTREELHERR